MTKEKATAISGIQKVYWLDQMDNILNELILLSKRIYVNPNENDRFNSAVEDRNLRFAKALQKRYPLHKYHRSQPILKKLAMIKSPLEIGLMQRAININA